jgi:hypothetical protein
MKFLSENKKILDATTENLMTMKTWLPGVYTPPPGVDSVAHLKAKILWKFFTMCCAENSTVLQFHLRYVVCYNCVLEICPYGSKHDLIFINPNK